MSGTLIDTGGYNLHTISGQTELINDMMEQSNSQFDALNNVSSLSVSAYTQLSLTIVPGQPAGTTTTSYVHGLGFPPVVIAYMLNPVSPSYLRLPYIERGVTGLGQVISNSYFTVDSNNLYFNRTITASFEIGVFTAAFYIFNVPLGT